MLRAATQRGDRRKGGSVVETAIIVGVFFMILFGIYEFCRVIFVKQLIDHAAREGARYAVTNTQASSLEADTKARVDHFMAGHQAQLSGYKVTLYRSDANGNNIGSATDAAFGEYIAVQVEGDYQTAVGSLLNFSTVRISSRAIMCSEAN